MKTTPLPFKKKLALKLFNRYRANEKSTHILNYLFWECTLRCNLSCLHCGSDCKKEAVVPDMPKLDFFRALVDIPQIITQIKTMMVLPEGKPVLRKVILKL